MTTYYIEENKKIVLFDTDKERLTNTLLFKPELQGLEILETEKIIYDNKIITQENYEKIKVQERQKEFNNDFFKTSLGYVRREVTMKDGTKKNFLTDVLPMLVTGIPILVYDEPDFTKEVTVEELVKVQKTVMVTDEFLQECKNQFIIDFYGFNPVAVKSDTVEDKSERVSQEESDTVDHSEQDLDMVDEDVIA